MDLNLETLKGEILDYLAASEFGVFRSFSGGLEELISCEISHGCCNPPAAEEPRRKGGAPGMEFR